ncbi:putative aquaporin 2 [Schizophyllum amplum]|uniref:Putative aquaporin 2 n=1 Tax=Schizophyllum amplum TaxID=97359 RepID=A0A550CIW2_9AGAR|nr:putative aquaporin 2 [Auriculariopsis ampla]
MHLSDVKRRPRLFSSWEKYRHTKIHWFVECFAEFLGVFLYTWCGVGSTANFVVGNLTDTPGLSSIFQIGIAYACGIVFALVICCATSGGHFHPAVTLVKVLFDGFPAYKGVAYVAAQIFGGYVACLLVYAQYRNILVPLEAALEAAGELAAIQFTPSGPAGIFGLYAPAGAHLGWVFLNEFVCDVVLGLGIFACIDPTNVFVPPPLAPILVGAVYAVCIWGYATPGLAANAARDVGGRLAAMTIWGMDASGGAYAAIAALTNIPAMLLAYVMYELLLMDTDRVIPAAQLDYLRVHQNHARTGTSLPPPSGSPVESTDKMNVTHIERA